MNTKIFALMKNLTGEADNWLITAVLVAVSGKILMVISAFSIYLIFGTQATASFSGRFTGDFNRDLFVFVIFAPPTESIIVLIVVFCTTFAHKYFSATASGLIAVPLHGLTPMSFSVFPVFFLQGLVQRNWTDRGRSWTGYATIFLAHLLHNASMLLLNYQIFKH